MHHPEEKEERRRWENKRGEEMGREGRRGEPEQYVRVESKRRWAMLTRRERQPWSRAPSSVATPIRGFSFLLYINQTELTR